MKRRNFLKASALAGGAMASTMPSLASTIKEMQYQTFNLNYAPHFGMFSNSAGEDLIDQIDFMAERGFRAFEDNGLMQRDVATQTRIGEALAKNDMSMGVFVLDRGGNRANSLTEGKEENVDLFLDGCRRAVEVAKRVNATWMTLIPGLFERQLPIGIQHANVIEALKRGAEILAPHGLVMVLEPLSDSPDLYLRGSDQAYMICKAVDSPACKILYDVYHLQKNEGHLIRNIGLVWDEIGYFQIGDNPGRKEPTTGEINYKNLFKYIHERSTDFILGMEHGNAREGKEGEEALIRAYREVDSFI